MSNEEQKGGAEGREPGRRGVEARPRNWLVPVILLSLRDLIPDAAADGEGGHRRVYVGDLQGRTGATDVLDH
jgi:hypothetical protein